MNFQNLHLQLSPTVNLRNVSPIHSNGNSVSQVRPLTKLADITGARDQAGFNDLIKFRNNFREEQGKSIFRENDKPNPRALTMNACYLSNMELYK